MTVSVVLQTYRFEKKFWPKVVMDALKKCVLTNLPTTVFPKSDYQFYSSVHVRQFVLENEIEKYKP